MEITTRIGCAIGCIYCPQNKLVSAYKEISNTFVMSYETFKTCIDKIPLDESIYFCGMSEPWLNPECTKMILYAHHRGHRIGVFTTLIGVNYADIDLIENIPFYSFSVHFPTDEGLEKIRIDDIYFKTLNRLLESSIRASFILHGNNIHSKLESIINNKNIKIQKLRVHTRAKNVTIEGLPTPIKKRGVIACERNLHSNILLPNGDVLLCCMDYGMKHVLGNLLRSDFGSLYCSEEFGRVTKGLMDESVDILCRHCALSNYTTFSAKFNSYISSIINIRSKSDLQDLIQRISVLINK
jgi:sulfatase maturation enzyme AslB (radical SAM superfamily)